ncbi:acetamidase/formamidase family protein [Mycolicibacterium komossense]|uniref:acetamidase/formamidase family protein n=1 Tax=Mycolicibacterium komossense TaxID=1779 RepID=UPI0021F25A3E|nr:acetamidase/formamidase family protein [Mycolicibacterium komossense]
MRSVHPGIRAALDASADLPAVVTSVAGRSRRVECREWTDAQIGNNDSANGVRDVDLSGTHMWPGPIHVEGAEPGDLLIVDILYLGPAPQEVGDAPSQGWGYTGIFAKDNGGGFIDFHVDLIKGGMEIYGVTTNPIPMPGNVELRYSEFVTFIDIGVEHDTDTQLDNDATVAHRNACLNAVTYLEKFSNSGPQA